jgi:pyocin large subunit-like protein
MGGRGASTGRGFIAKGFPQGLLETDYAKHKDEFGDKITIVGYNTKAKNLLNSKIGGDVKGFTSDTGRVYRYNKKNNEFAICESNGMIAAFFKPSDKIKYWER